MAAVESLITLKRAARTVPDVAAEAFQDDLRSTYRKAAADYRRDDEIEVRTDHHCWIWKTLADLTSSFEREISALDAGCGTGRHFHCLKNVKRLVGLDLSPEMLRAARVPIREELISVQEIELVCGDVHHVTFPPHCFDLIYSLGMFALGCRFTVEICNRFHDWLAPGGKLFFNVTDRAGLSWFVRGKRSVRGVVYQFLPAERQRAWDARANHVTVCELTLPELRKLMRGTLFRRFQVTSHPCESPLWKGSHLECLAYKEGRGSDNGAIN